MRHTLKDWYENHALYHKIGYLIASDSQSLQQLYALSIGKTKREFNKELDRLITESIHIGKNYAELSYENSVEYSQLSRLLLLFNVESVRQIDGQTQRFPFHLFKYQNTGKVAWSLEHIHAQNSKGMRKQEQWKEWLRLHIPSVEVLCEDDGQLLADMQAALAKQSNRSLRAKEGAVFIRPFREYLLCRSTESWQASQGIRLVLY